MQYTSLGTHRGDIRNILGLYWDNGKENGNCYTGLYRVLRAVCIPELIYSPGSSYVSHTCSVS